LWREEAGLVAALLNASQQVGGALGLAVFSAVATSPTNHLLADRVPAPEALTSRFQRALLACSICLAGAARFATNTREPLADESRARPLPHGERSVSTS
jgi:hypothetical protein